MKTYLDSSFVCSLYIKDVNHLLAVSLLRKPVPALLLSNLTELEVTNALELRVFRNELRRSEADQAHAAFQQDIQNGVFTVFDLDATAFLYARRLILQHASSIGCRTADILHVASALACGADAIFTFDVRQSDLARRVNLQTN